MSPSDFVRDAVARALGSSGSTEPTPEPHGCDNRVRLSLRMRRDDAEAMRRAAREAGLALGDFIAMLVHAPSVSANATPPAAALSSLTASCAELATLSRNVNHLIQLLRQGSIRAAQEYRQMLDTLDADIRTHLELATTVVTQLRPLLRLAST